MKKSFFCAAGILFFLFLSISAWADDYNSLVSLKYEDLGLGFCKIHVFYNDSDYGYYTKTATSESDYATRITTVTVYDETFVPLKGVADLSLIRKLSDAFTDMETARPITKFLWGGLALIPGIPMIALNDPDDGLPYLGIAFTAVGLVCSAVGGVWKLIYSIAQSEFNKYEPLVIREIEKAF